MQLLTVQVYILPNCTTNRTLYFSNSGKWRNFDENILYVRTASAEKLCAALTVLTANQLYLYKLQFINLPAVSQMLVTSKHWVSLWSSGALACKEAETIHMYAAHSQRYTSDAVSLINDACLLLSECYSVIIESDFVDPYIYQTQKIFRCG